MAHMGPKGVPVPGDVHAVGCACLRLPPRQHPHDTGRKERILPQAFAFGEGQPIRASTAFLRITL